MLEENSGQKPIFNLGISLVKFWKGLTRKTELDQFQV